MEQRENIISQEERVEETTGSDSNRVSRRRLLGMGAVGLTGIALAGITAKPASAAGLEEGKTVSLTDFLSLMVSHPELLNEVKADPEKVASLYGWHISDEDAKAIKQNFDVNAFLEHATSGDTPASKAASGVQLTPREGQIQL